MKKTWTASRYRGTYSGDSAGVPEAQEGVPTPNSGTARSDKGRSARVVWAAKESVHAVTKLDSMETPIASPLRFLALCLWAFWLTGAAAAPVPRIPLADRRPAADLVLNGLELHVSYSLIAKPDFNAMGAGPRQAGSATLRIEAVAVAGEGNPYRLTPGSQVEGLALAVHLRRAGEGGTWVNPLMEWITCTGGPHYEATFILERPGLYFVDLEGLADSSSSLDGATPLPGRMAASGFATSFTVDFSMPDDALGEARAAWESAMSSTALEMAAGTSGRTASLMAAESVSDDMSLLLTWDTRTSYSAGCSYQDDTGKFAIIGATDGTQIVEVTNPAHPVEWGFIPGNASTWRECKTYGTHAYVTTEAAGSGLQIIDLSNPRAPFLAATNTAAFTTAHDLYINQSTGFLYANGTRLSGSFAGMQIFDLTINPVNLVRVGTFTARYVHDAYEALDPLSGTYRLYLSEINNGLHEIWDDTNRSNPILINSWPTPGSFTHNSTVNPGQTIVMTTDENDPGGSGAVYDISNPTNEVLQSTYRGGGAETVIHNAHFDDEDPELVWVAHYTQGARLLDLHRPSFPLEIGHYDTYLPTNGGEIGCWEAWPFDRDGWAYLFDMQTGLYVVRYDPAGGRLSGVVRNAGSGVPIAGATVLDLGSGRAVRSNGLGVYALRAGPGTAALRVHGYGGYTTTASVAVGAGQRVDLDIALEPLPAGNLTGFVRRAGTGDPIEGAVVRNLASGESRTTLGDGSFSFGPVPVGTQRLDAAKFGFAGGRALVTLGPSGASVTLSLEPALLADDAEADRGWTLGIGTDTANASGRWVRVDPNGTDLGLTQPEDDHTPAPGAKAFVTGNGPAGGAAEANDVDGGVTTLESPVMNAALLGALSLDYWRWFSNSRGFTRGTTSAGSLSVEVSNNNGTTWVSLEAPNREANDWTNRVLDVGSRVPLTNQMKVRFRANSGTQTTAVVEAAVDDIQLLPGCLAAFNPQAPDSDGDGQADACDVCPADGLNDADGDGVCGEVDLSPFASDPGQADADGDGVGDAADDCVLVADADQADNDRDGMGNACDPDDDNDGTDDALDSDDDGDGVLDGSDNCAGLSNSDQADHGSNGTGDVCDLADGLVNGLRFLPNKTTLVWKKESGSTSYNVYRGELGSAALLPYAACFLRGLATPFTDDPELPNPSDGSFYLVTRAAGGVESSPGYASNGTERQILTRCP